MKGKRGQMMEKYGSGTKTSDDIREKRKNKLDEIAALAKEQEDNGIFEGDLDQGEVIGEVRTEFKII